MFAKKKKQTFVESKRFAAKVSPYFALHHKAQITSRLWQLFVVMIITAVCLQVSWIHEEETFFFSFYPIFSLHLFDVVREPYRKKKAQLQIG